MTFYQSTRQKLSRSLVSLSPHGSPTAPAEGLTPRVAEVWDLLQPSQHLKFGDYTVHLPKLAALFSWSVPELISTLQEKYTPLQGHAEPWQYIPPHLNFHIDADSLRSLAFPALIDDCVQRTLQPPQLQIHIQYQELLTALGYTAPQAVLLAKSIAHDDLSKLFQDVTELNLIRALARQQDGSLPSFISETSLQFYQGNLIFHKDPIIAHSRIALLGITLMML